MTDCARIQPFASELAKILSNPANAELIKYKWGDITTKGIDGLPQVLSDMIRATKPLSNTYSDSEQLIDFRKRFSQAWHQIPAKDFETRKQFLKWVVETWGNIHGNNDETFSLYVKAVDEDLADKNISSISKCLAFVCPEKRYVYDSRVSLVLNTILEKLNPSTDWQFQLVQGQGKLSKEFNKKWKKRGFTVDGASLNRVGLSRSRFSDLQVSTPLICIL